MTMAYHEYSREELAARLGVPDRRHSALLFRRTGRFGMILLLISLGMLFAGSMLGYLIIRSWLAQPQVFLDDDNTWQTVTRTVPDIHLPWTLWLSTGVIVASSFTMHLALQAVALEKQVRFRALMLTTLGLALIFVGVQAPSLMMLLQEHAALREQAVGLYGLVFFLILVHALHVIGGIVPLVILTVQAWRQRYDHESHEPVRLLTMYWHFLDVVWIVMFLMLLVAG